MQRLYYILLSLIIMSHIASATTASPLVKAWIDVKQLDGKISVVPYCKSATALTVDYELVSNKSGPTGNSRSQQSGTIQLKPGENNSLAKLQISLSTNDFYMLELKIYRQGQLIASDSITVPASL